MRKMSLRLLAWRWGSFTTSVSPGSAVVRRHPAVSEKNGSDPHRRSPDPGVSGRTLHNLSAAAGTTRADSVNAVGGIQLSIRAASRRNRRNDTPA